jgi:hypothetical protein
MIRYTVILESRRPRGAAVRQLRALLKCCWRAWGLRCIEARELPGEAEPTTCNERKSNAD